MNNDFVGDGLQTFIKPDIILDIFIGGFRGPSHFYLIEKRNDKFLVKYFYSQNGRYPNSNNDSEFDIKEKSEKEVMEFVKKLHKKIKLWKKDYDNPDILDGTQWYIKFCKENLEYSGTNKFPLTWSFVVNFINNFFKGGEK